MCILQMILLPVFMAFSAYILVALQFKTAFGKILKTSNIIIIESTPQSQSSVAGTYADLPWLLIISSSYICFMQLRILNIIDSIIAFQNGEKLKVEYATLNRESALIFKYMCFLIALYQ